MTDAIRDIAARFGGGAVVRDIAPLDGGHINDTYLVSWVERTERHILQRVNPRIFGSPHKALGRARRLMDNIERVTTHLSGASPGPHMELVRCDDGRSFVEIDEVVWRMYNFIEEARCVAEPRDPQEVFAAAEAFGTFHRTLADLPGPPVHEVIPRFHDTQHRYELLSRAAESIIRKADRCQGGIVRAALMKHGELANGLLHLEVRRRVVHNDAKIANVLFEADSDRVLCVIDYDTIMPGLVLHDVGDMIRSMTSTAPEDAPEDPRAEVDIDLYSAVINGYRSGAGSLLSRSECQELHTAGLVITFEQAVRFLTDFYLGDCYYRVAHPEHNLHRCMRQVRLLESLVARADELRAV